MLPPAYRLGVNHHLLFPAGMEDPAIHETTLAEVLAWPEFPVVDGYCAGDAAQRAREAAMIRASGKGMVYNTPLLGFLPGCDPNATEAATIERTRAVALQHLDAAAACGAHQINIASGGNPASVDREAAWAGWIDFLTWHGTEAGVRGLRVVIEPFDQSIGKNLLIGPTCDAVRSIDAVRARGVETVGLMVDMGHLPLMGESFADGVTLSHPYLWHVHLGSAVMRDPAHPWYGDYHPPLGLPDGEHDTPDLARFLTELVRNGYFSTPAVTLTMEMRPYPGWSERASVECWLVKLADAWALVDA
jgi:sugar phosphate isomerase/epimerase